MIIYRVEKNGVGPCQNKDAKGNGPAPMCDFMRLWMWLSPQERRTWRFGCMDVADLNEWFDIQDLLLKGYQVKAYEVKEYAIGDSKKQVAFKEGKEVQSSQGGLGYQPH